MSDELLYFNKNAISWVTSKDPIGL